MNVNTILTPEVASVVITAVVIPTILKILGLATAFIESKAGNEKANKYIESAEKSVETAVVAVSQVYVDGLKKSGTFDQAAREEAFNQARERALSIMSDEMKKFIIELYGDLNPWLDNKIEYYVGLSKKAA